jgi:putative flippase GtrA
MIKAKPTARGTQVRFLRFVAVGISTAAVMFGGLAGFKTFLAPVVAFSCAYVVATSFHYACNRFWALKSDRSDTHRQLAEYLLTVVVSYVINVGVFKFSQSVLHLGVMWAAVTATPPASVVVFFLLNYHVFRTSRA